MFDLCVIGAGWAGFNAALRAAELGNKVCLIEKDRLGGVCLNRGCIPTKALVNSSKLFSHLKEIAYFSSYTISTGLAEPQTFFTLFVDNTGSDGLVSFYS